MKKILCLILIALNVTVIGCNSSNLDKKPKNNDSASTDSVQGETKNPIIELNKPFEVNTEHGSYNFTIQSVTKTNWWERSKKGTDKTVILLNLECENIDFSNKDKTGFEGVSLYDAFTIKDDKNYMLEHFSMSYDDVNMGSTPIPKNTKGKISMPFVADNDIKSVSVVFNRGGTINDITVNE